MRSRTWAMAARTGSGKLRWLSGQASMQARQPMQLVVSYRVKPVSASLVRQPRGQPVTQGASAQCIQDTEWKLRSPCLFSRVKVWRNGC